MPQIKSQFTSEERLAFENKYEIGVYSHEALIEILMLQDKRIKQLEERLMEVASYIQIEKYVGPVGGLPLKTPLADKWK